LPRRLLGAGFWGANIGEKNGESKMTLKTYVRATIDAALTDYIDREGYAGDKTALIDDISDGFNIGFWSELIQTSDRLDKFQSFKKGIAIALSEFLSQTNEDILDITEVSDALIVMVSTPEEIAADEQLTKIACWLVQFGVEWETHSYCDTL
jgi:hypothetical protein